MLHFDIIDDSCEEELEKERRNEGRVIGELYHYPESFIQLLGGRCALHRLRWHDIVNLAGNMEGISVTKTGSTQYR